jgi:hypothetical protein
MPLVLSHGQAKSGSSFLFQSAILACETENGMSQKQLRGTFFPKSYSQGNYLDVLTDDDVLRLLEYVPSGKYYTIKTHGRLTNLIRSKIEAGKIMAFTSIRDPRDMVVSMLDAGERDRDRKANNFFTTLHNIQDTLVHVKFGVARTSEWMSCHNVAVFPYYLTATNQDAAITHLLDHIGLSHRAAKVVRRFGHEKSQRIWQFHKGTPDRFLDDISRKQVSRLTGELALEIGLIDAEAEKWMNQFGYNELYVKLRNQRDERLRMLAEIDQQDEQAEQETRWR